MVIKARKIRTIPKQMQACKICEHFYVNLQGPESRIMCRFHNSEIDLKHCCESFDLNDAVDDGIVQTAKEIVDAFLFLRITNHSIPDNTLDFMKQASLWALRDVS